MSDYENERYTPTFANCFKLKLKFDGRFLHIEGGKRCYFYPAVSGKKDKNGSFNYQLQNQSLPFKGPIPSGKYWIRPDELWERNAIRKMYYKVIFDEQKITAHRNGWGNFRISIHPYPNTKTYGRGGFFIHGGKTPGSAGCIDLTDSMPQFVQALKEETGLIKCFIELTVDYEVVL